MSVNHVLKQFISPLSEDDLKEVIKLYIKYRKESILKEMSEELTEVLSNALGMFNSGDVLEQNLVKLGFVQQQVDFRISKWYSRHRLYLSGTSTDYRAELTYKPKNPPKGLEGQLFLGVDATEGLDQVIGLNIKIFNRTKSPYRAPASIMAAVVNNLLLNEFIKKIKG